MTTTWRQRATSLSRRGVLRRVGGLSLAALLGLAEAEAKRKKRKRKRQRKKRSGFIASPPPPPPPPPPSPSPPPPPLTAISCPGPAQTVIGATKSFAQTFLATGSGVIASAEVEVSAFPDGTNFSLQIRTVDEDDAPTISFLASAQVTDVPATPVDTPRTLMVDFNPPAPVVAGTTYALVLREVTANGYLASCRTGDACAGKLFTDSNGDGSFSLFANRDLIFSVSP